MEDIYKPTSSGCCSCTLDSRHDYQLAKYVTVISVAMVQNIRVSYAILLPVCPTLDTHDPVYQGA